MRRGYEVLFREIRLTTIKEIEPVADVIVRPVSVADEPPLDFEQNVEYRKNLAVRLNADEAFRNQYLERASKDVVYFTDSVCWTYQAKPYPLALPMILYPIQRRLMRVLQTYGGLRNFHTDKSRDMGITWCILIWMFWMWMFVPDVKFHLASWKEKLVDQRGNPGTHFAKLDHLIEWLPVSIRPVIRNKIERQSMLLRHPKHGAVFTGESTNRKMGRSDRNFAGFLDEFPHMGDTPKDGYAILDGMMDTTNCLLLNGTPFGIGNAFADYKTKCPISMSFWWPDHPVKGAGLRGYNLRGKGDHTSRDRFLAMRPRSGFWSDQVEQLRGKITSPWYEHVKSEAPSPQYVGQEIDIDYSGSGWQYFGETLIRKILTEDVIPPFHAGKIVFNPESGNYAGFDENGVGPLLLWTHLRDNGKAANENDWVCGVDVAAGSRKSSDKDESVGHSNSCAVMINLTTGEVGAELTVSGVDAAEFAYMTVAFCKMFNNAHMIFEGNGPGLHFMKVVVDYLHYPNLYYRRNLKTIESNETTEPGFWTTPTSKSYVFSAYRTALNDGLITERCKNAALEMRMYQEATGTVVHAMAVSTIDPTGARDNHADRVVARVMAYHGMYTLGYNPYDPEEIAARRIIDPSSIAGIRSNDQIRAHTGELVY